MEKAPENVVWGDEAEAANPLHDDQLTIAAMAEKPSKEKLNLDASKTNSLQNQEKPNLEAPLLFDGDFDDVSVNPSLASVSVASISIAGVDVLDRTSHTLTNTKTNNKFAETMPPQPATRDIHRGYSESKTTRKPLTISGLLGRSSEGNHLKDTAGENKTNSEGIKDKGPTETMPPQPATRDIHRGHSESKKTRKPLTISGILGRSSEGSYLRDTAGDYKSNSGGIKDSLTDKQDKIATETAREKEEPNSLQAPPEKVPKKDSFAETVPKEDPSSETVPKQDPSSKTVTKGDPSSETVPIGDQASEAIQKEDPSSNRVVATEGATNIVPSKQQAPKAVSMEQPYSETRSSEAVRRSDASAGKDHRTKSPKQKRSSSSLVRSASNYAKKASNRARSLSPMRVFGAASSRVSESKERRRSSSKEGRRSLSPAFLRKSRSSASPDKMADDTTQQSQESQRSPMHQRT